MSIPQQAPPEPLSPDTRDSAPDIVRPGLHPLAGGFAARLLAEAVRIHEGAAGPSPDAASAEAVARAGGGDLERRILARAEALDRRLGLASAIAHVRATIDLVALGILALAALAGIAAAHGIMGAGGGTVVNFYAVLFAALGPETVALLLWAGLALAGSPRAAGLIGRIAAGLGGRLLRLSHRDPAHAAALGAVGGATAGGAYGRWTLGAVTHGAWLAFLAAMLGMILFLLSTRSYVFVWETTILSAETYVPLTRWLAAFPGLVGFAVPGPEEVRASQWLGDTGQIAAGAAAARDGWAGLLVGSIVVYGIVPRLALLAACLALRARASRRFRLDTARPAYARLAPRLMPQAQAIGYADSDAGTEPSRRADRPQDAPRIAPNPDGPVAVLGIEIEAPAAGWPPPLPGAVLDLGRAQGGQDFAAAFGRLRQAAPAPRRLVLVCALTATPDRGLLARIDEVANATTIPLVLLLTGGQRLRERTGRDGALARIADWHALAKEAGVAEVIEIDLDRLTDSSRARLAELGGASARVAAAPGRLERAFAQIRAESASWTDRPDLEVQAELHRAIARLYEGSGGWPSVFDPPGLAGADLTARLRAGSDRLVGLLPGRLALDPRWLSAGALAGGLGCIAIAALAAPAAIAALPLWAGFGATLGAVLRAYAPEQGAARQAGETPRPDLAAAVRAAALFALVLEAQGHDEATITRLLDEAIGAEEPALGSAAEIDAWLAGVLRRYRDASAREGRVR